MTKKPKPMTIILLIIAVVFFVYAGAWVKVGFMTIPTPGQHVTYTPKYGFPFIWVVTTTRDTTLPKLSSGEVPPPYEVNVFTASKITGSAVKKICSKSSYEIDITEYSNTSGEVGGYLESMTQSIYNITNIKDAPTVLWDKEGNHVGLDSLFNNEKQREDFTTKFSEMRKIFPNQKTFSCPKK